MTKPFQFHQFRQRNNLEVRFTKMPEGWHFEIMRQGHLLVVSVVYPDFAKCLRMARNLFESIQNRHFTLSRSDGKDVSLYGTS